MKKNILLITALLGALSFSATAEAATVKFLVTFNESTEQQYGGHLNVRMKIWRALENVRLSFKWKNYGTKLKMDPYYLNLPHYDRRSTYAGLLKKIKKNPDYKELRKVRNKGKYDIVVAIERIFTGRGAHRMEMTTQRSGWYNFVDESSLDNKFYRRLAIARGFGYLFEARVPFAGKGKDGRNTLMTIPSHNYPAKSKYRLLSGKYSLRAGFNRTYVHPEKNNNSRRVEKRHWWVSNYKR